MIIYRIHLELHYASLVIIVKNLVMESLTVNSLDDCCYVKENRRD